MSDKTAIGGQGLGRKLFGRAFFVIRKPLNCLTLRTVRSMYKERGFSLVEHIAILVIIEILSVAVSSPWFRRTAFEKRGNFDQLIRATRYAQNLAVITNGVWLTEPLQRGLNEIST